MDVDTKICLIIIVTSILCAVWGCLADKKQKEKEAREARRKAEEERRRLIAEKEAKKEAIKRRIKEIEWELEHKEYSSREMKADPEKLCDKELVNACEYVRRELRHNPESSLLKDRLNEIWAEVEKRVRLDKLAKSDEETRANIAVIAEDINAIRMKRDK